jgi:hypothetical protein
VTGNERAELPHCCLRWLSIAIREGSPQQCNGSAIASHNGRLLHPDGTWTQLDPNHDPRGCPVCLKAEPEPSPPTKTYEIPVCPVLWRVVTPGRDEGTSHRTHILAPSAAMALAAAARFYNWPRLTSVRELANEPGWVPEQQPALTAEIADAYPRTLSFTINVYQVRALDDFQRHVEKGCPGAGSH